MKSLIWLNYIKTFVHEIQFTGPAQTLILEYR